MREHGTPDDRFDAALGGLDHGRRAFLKKLAVGTAFAAPIVSSFTMTGIKAVYAQTPSISGVGGAGANRNASAGSESSTTSTTAGRFRSEGRPDPTTTTSSTTTTSTVTTSPNQTVG